MQKKSKMQHENNKTRHGKKTLGKQYLLYKYKNGANQKLTKMYKNNTKWHTPMLEREGVVEVAMLLSTSSGLDSIGVLPTVTWIAPSLAGEPTKENTAPPGDCLSTRDNAAAPSVVGSLPAWLLSSTAAAVILSIFCSSVALCWGGMSTSCNG